MLFKKVGHCLVVGVISMLSLPVFSAVIEHELGSTQVPDSPQRIVVLEFSFVDALAAVNVAPVGLADDNKPERIVAAYRKIIGSDWISVGTRKTPSLELTASLKPDLIIADKKRHSAAYATLSEIAPTIVLDSLVGDYPAAVKQMSVIGNALGKEEEMEQRITEHKAKIAAYAETFKALSDGMYVQFATARASRLTLHSASSYNGSLLNAFGFSSKLNPTDGDARANFYVPTTLEQLSELNPEVLILGNYADVTIIDQWKNEALYQNLSAVKAGKVFHVDAHSWSRLRGMVAAESTAEDLSAIMKKISAKK